MNTDIRDAPQPPLLGTSMFARLACALIQPMLSRVVRRVALRHPSLFARLGSHQSTDFLIEKTGTMY